MTAPFKKHLTEIQMRFADTDALGHVNNGSYIVYAETGRLSFLHILGGAVRSLILAHVSVDFRRQVVFGEAVSVETWIKHIGTTSVTLQQNILAGGIIAAETRSVVVFFDYDTQRPKPWTAEARAAFADYVEAPPARPDA